MQCGDRRVWYYPTENVRRAQGCRACTRSSSLSRAKYDGRDPSLFEQSDLPHGRTVGEPNHIDSLIGAVSWEDLDVGSSAQASTPPKVPSPSGRTSASLIVPSAVRSILNSPEPLPNFTP
jgi:hypothetical protein